MRIWVSSMLGLLAVATAVWSQGGPPPGSENLDTVLRGWEKAMTDLQSFAVDINRTALDKQLNTKDDFKGWAVFAKATEKLQPRAHLLLTKVNNPAVFEKYICTDSILYEYAHSMKKVRMHQMPKNKMIGGAQQESFLSFLFGMSAQQAVSRYHMEYKGSDAHYHYIRILPKQDQDKGDFSEARLSLLRANNLPAQMWYHQPNGNEITWNFSKMQINVNIPDKWFQPDLPKDWVAERVEPRGLGANLAPTTVRNQKP